MTGHGSKFGRKKEETIAALFSQRNIEEAARVARTGTKTLFRWLRMPEFQDAYRQARREAYSQSIARLHPTSSAAVSTLLQIMVDRRRRRASRVRAADRVLEHTAKAIETDDIGARVSELDRATELAKA